MKQDQPALLGLVQQLFSFPAPVEGAEGVLGTSFIFKPLLGHPFGWHSALVWIAFVVCVRARSAGVLGTLSAVFYLFTGGTKGIEVPPGICNSAATRAFAKSTTPDTNTRTNFSQQLCF